MRKESSATALRLSLVRVLGEDDAPGATSALALQRWGERVQPYVRAEDAAMGVRPPRPPAAPPGSRQGGGGGAAAAAEEEEDPFAWAMQDPVQERAEDSGAEEDEDPFAWAAAAPQGPSDGGEGGGADEDDGSWAMSDEPDFSDDYLEDKYG